MSFGTLRKKTKENRSLLVKLYFVVGSILLLTIFVTLVSKIREDAREEAQLVPELFANFHNFVEQDNYETRLFQYVLESVIGQIKYPIIMTDKNKKPTRWKNIGVDETKGYEDLNAREKRIIHKTLDMMMQKNWVIPLYYKDAEATILSYTFFSESKAMRLLKYLPFIEMAVIILFILFGLYGVVFLKKSEKDKLWVGLAKETAHQFGTPITSLLGWISLLRIRLEDVRETVESDEILESMEIDIDRLNKVASRFGKVGSNIKKKPVKIHNSILTTLEYFEKRLPNSASHKIGLEFISSIEDISIDIDEALFKWALENVLKNAIDAMRLRGGTIVVEAFTDDQYVIILVKDQGKGMPKKLYKEIFKAGYTSKTRGWGLGLSLSQRIIEEFHDGHIGVVESTVDVGTTMEIALRKYHEKQ